MGPIRQSISNSRAFGALHLGMKEFTHILEM